MPLAKIEIEQVETRRWTAEVEAGGQPGGPNFKRQPFTAQTLPDLWKLVLAFYEQQVPVGTTRAASLAQEGTMDDKNQKPEPSLPDDIRPDQRIPGPGGTNNADNAGLAPIPPTEPGEKLPGGRMSAKEIEDAKEREGEGEAEHDGEKTDDPAKPVSQPASQSPRHAQPHPPRPASGDRTSLPPLRDRK